MLGREIQNVMYVLCDRVSAVSGLRSLAQYSLPQDKNIAQSLHVQRSSFRMQISATI